MAWMIRAGAADDVEAMQRIELEAGARFREIGLDAIADDDPPAATTLLRHVDAGTAWVAVDETGHRIGYATASVVDDNGHLDQVSVVPDAAGRGIGRALIDHVHAWARATGHDAVTLTTFTNVAWNGPYYERLGYEMVAAEHLGPELAAIRADEIAAGLEVSPRTAMRINL
jgi:GNAT superfamily N-acetyltransferase